MQTGSCKCDKLTLGPSPTVSFSHTCTVGYVAHLQPRVFVPPVQDGKTPMETLYSWQNGAKSLLSDFTHHNNNNNNNRPDQ